MSELGNLENLKKLDREAIRADADAGFYDKSRYLAHARTLLDANDALAGALRESVRQCGKCPVPHVVGGPPSRCVPCTDALALLDRLGYGRAECPYGDKTCPCQDGDLCHYEGKDAWPPPVGYGAGEEEG